jgi:membrane protein implicated in regulation of membrane protease activity
VKRTIKDWLIFFALLADEAAAIGLVLLVLWFFRITLPLWTAIVLALALGGVAFIFQRSVVPSFRRRRVTGAEGMVGMNGEVIEPLRPVGLVKVKGEYWEARAENGDVPIGETVEVTGVDGLMLKVKLK